MFVYYVFFLILSWPVRTLSFSHDGEMLASGSEDLIIDIVCITYLVGNNLALLTSVIIIAVIKYFVRILHFLLILEMLKLNTECLNGCQLVIFFIFVLIRVTNLVNMRKIRKNLHTKMRRGSLISICMKE